MTGTLFPQRLRLVTEKTEAQRIVAMYQRRGVYIERRGKGAKPAMYVTRGYRGVVVVRRRMRKGAASYLFHRYGKLSEADIAELHGLNPPM